MEICEQDHTPIVFSARRCPLCVCMDDLRSSESELEEREITIAHLKEDIVSLSSEH